MSKHRKNTIEISGDDFATLSICAIRYCQGRMTYMPATVQSIVSEHLGKVSDNALNIMIDDCDFQRKMKIYGDDIIDKPGWLRWEQNLREEKERRKGEANES